MLSDGRNFIRTGWWLSVFPGVAIMVTVLAINLIGDGLRDVLDPRMRADRQQLRRLRETGSLVLSCNRS